MCSIIPDWAVVTAVAAEARGTSLSKGLNAWFSLQLLLEP